MEIKAIIALITLNGVRQRKNQQHRINVLGKDSMGKHNPMYGKSGKNSPVFKGYIYKINPDTGDVQGKYAGSCEAAKAIGGFACNIIRAIKTRKKVPWLLLEKIPTKRQISKRI